MNFFKKRRLYKRFEQLKAEIHSKGITYEKGVCVLVSFSLAFNKSISRIEDELWRNGNNVYGIEQFNQLNNIISYLRNNNLISFCKRVDQINSNDLSCKDKYKKKWSNSDGNLYYREIIFFFPKGRYFLIGRRHISYLEDGEIFDTYYDNTTIVEYVIGIL